MLVASDLGKKGVGTVLRRKRNFKAVQRSVPGSDVVFAMAPQAPFFNIGAKLMKPQCVVEQPRPIGVPLKSLQQYSHAEGASLFNAPVMLIPEPLKVVIPTTAKIDYEGILAEISVPFETGFDYNKGIRPSARAIKGDTVDEPAFPFPTRPVARAVPAKVETGTFEIGALEYQVLRR